MKEKLKAVLHRRKRSNPTHSPRTSYEQSESGSPRAEQYPDSHRQRDRPRSSTSQSASSRANQVQKPNATHKHTINGRSASSSPDSAHGFQSNGTNSSQPVANENKPRTSAVAPGEDSTVESSNTGHSTPYHDADHLNPLPPAPISTNYENGNAREKSVGQAVTTNGNLAEGPQWHSAEDMNKRLSRSSESDRQGNQDMSVKPAGFDSQGNSHGAFSGDEWKTKQRSMLEGIVDLNDTVDTDRDTSWAPAVTHEVVKPHEHEVIQHKIYREIHNYTYYHRLQPVMQTEVLPPRHFIPNPDGEGLIEISADELPSRTGKNRWWDIVQKEPVLPETPFQWRTEPQIIEGKPYMTDEGFERRETTIIYPPTLEDMSGYGGMVQPVHFDHKTGRRWLGEITTVEKLKRELEDTSDESFMPMKDVTANLPGIPEGQVVKRKPIDRDPL